MVLKLVLVQTQEATMNRSSHLERLRSSRSLKEALSTRPEVVGVNNKENLKPNQHHPLPTARQDLLPSNGLEDSGYLSLNNSQLIDPPDSETDPIQELPSTHPSAHTRTYKEPKLSSSHTRDSVRSPPTWVSPRPPPTRVSPRSPPTRVSVRSPPTRVSPRSPHTRVSPRSSPIWVSPRSPPTRVSPRSPHTRVSVRSPPPRVSVRSPPARVSPRSPHTRVSVRSPHTRVSPRSPPTRVSVRSPPTRVSVRSPPTRVSVKSSERLLPIISFQKAVCAELARHYQQTQSYDLRVVKQLAEQHHLERVIGRQMGRDHVDVFCGLLSRNLRALLSLILRLLGDLDLMSCRAVSQMWRKIILEDGASVQRIQRARTQLGNRGHVTRAGSGPGVTRGAVGRRVLSDFQMLASPGSSPAASRKCPAPLEQETRFNAFLQVAGSLQHHEGLRCCQRCRSPARHHSGARRAVCTRPDCQFDFCTLCHGTFHGALPCPSARPPRSSCPRTTAQGAARRQRTLRRL